MRKIDVLSKTCRIWHEDGCYVSEPIFLRNPSDETVGNYWKIRSDHFFVNISGR